MATHEQGRPVDRVAGRAQPTRERAHGVTQLAAGPAPGLPIHHHDGREAGPAPLFGLGELRGVEAAVAAPPDHDHIAHHDRIAQTSAPATGRTSPLTARASSLARYRTAATRSSSSTQRTFASFICARLSAVRMVPGATAFTRIRSPASSRASARVSPATAALAAM